MILFKSDDHIFSIHEKDIRFVQVLRNFTEINHSNKNIIGLSVIHGRIFSCINLFGNREMKHFITALNFNEINTGIMCDEIIGFSEEMPEDAYILSAKEFYLNNFRFNQLPHKLCFHFRGNIVAKNLAELHFHIKKIDEKSFKHHVNEHKNDFAKWIRDVLHYNEIADKIEKIRDKDGIIKTLSEFI